MNVNFDFSGQSGIVTGAASGIGKALAYLLAESGAGLTLVDRDPETFPAVAAKAQELAQVEPLILPHDVSIQEQVQDMVDQTMAKFGKIDFLVTSAGVIYRSSFLDITVEEWDDLMATNLRGVFMCCLAVAKEMAKAKSGNIVNIASLAGRSISLIGGAHYCSSKHAIVGLSRHMARDMAPYGLRVNAFCPGATKTPMVMDRISPEEHEALNTRIPLGRLSEPEEQAAAIAFLLSDASSYMNGACLDSNGGSAMI